jgi:hypothetical protein
VSFCYNCFLCADPDAISSLPPPPPSKARVQAGKHSQVQWVSVESKGSQAQATSMPLNHAKVGMGDGRERPRKRGKGASKRSRPRAGRGKQEQRAGEASHRIHRLRERALRNGEALCSDEFSLQRDGLSSSTGWQGRAPPQKTQLQLKHLYETGEIQDLLQVFYPVPYPMPPQ